MLTRRQYFLLSVPLILAAGSLPLIKLITSSTSESAFRYKRSKKRNNCINQNPINNILKPGFYLNKDNTVHYVSDKGICLSLKNVHKTEKDRFIKNLKHIDILSEKLQVEKLHVPFALSVFSKEISRLEKAHQIESAALVTQIALQVYNTKRYDSMKRFSKIINGFISRNENFIQINRITSIKNLISNLKF